MTITPAEVSRALSSTFGGAWQVSEENGVLAVTTTKPLTLHDRSEVARLLAPVLDCPLSIQAPRKAHEVSKRMKRGLVLAGRI